MTEQTILITGANRGIGLELAGQFAADGWNVIACCRKSVETSTFDSYDPAFIPASEIISRLYHAGF
jgi:NAD(P)-dependent dehydrogenase (short-subunit alcohol dehydrogenase family)